MDQYVSERNDARSLGDLLRHVGIEPRQLIQGFSQEFELSLIGRVQSFIALVSGEVLACDEPVDPLQGLCAYWVTADLN
ncbi:MAG: hypothetical protein RLW61_17015 [Gammaproteobacteria bacterium]